MVITSDTHPEILVEELPERCTGHKFAWRKILTTSVAAVSATLRRQSLLEVEMDWAVVKMR